MSGRNDALNAGEGTTSRDECTTGVASRYIVFSMAHQACLILRSVAMKSSALRRAGYRYFQDERAIEKNSKTTCRLRDIHQILLIASTLC
jgi:hypothetical protein